MEILFYCRKTEKDPLVEICDDEWIANQNMIYSIIRSIAVFSSRLFLASNDMNTLLYTDTHGGELFLGAILYLPLSTCRITTIHRLIALKERFVVSKFSHLYTHDFDVSDK